MMITTHQTHSQETQMTTTTPTTLDTDDLIMAQADAERLAARTLRGTTPMSWSEAGYTTALDAASAMVGDAGSTDFDREVHRRACLLVAAELSAD